MQVQFAVRVRKLREAAGLSRPEVSYQLRSFPKTMWASPEKLRRMEAGEIAEEDVDPVFVSVLASIYGCKVSDLSPLAAEGGKRLSDLLVQQMRCSTRSRPIDRVRATAAA